MPTARANQTVGLAHPDHGNYIVVHTGNELPADHPLVATYPWAFDFDNIERATAAPGEKRKPGRPKGSRNQPKES